MPRFLHWPYAQPPHTCTHTHNNCTCTHTYPHWHERHILTSSCSTLDQQKGSHMQSERGLWGQGAGFGKQPHCETCMASTTQLQRPHTQGLTIFIRCVILKKKIIKYIYCLWIMKPPQLLKNYKNYKENDKMGCNTLWYDTKQYDLIWYHTRFYCDQTFLVPSVRCGMVTITWQKPKKSLGVKFIKLLK